MKIILIQVLLPLATYFIEVMIGDKIGYRRALKKFEAIVQWNLQAIEDEIEDLADPEDLQHVGYSQSECGYDK